MPPKAVKGEYIETVSALKNSAIVDTNTPD
jgi:hypothetical protein